MTGAGDWPRTGRVLPWMLAAFLVLVWLVPIDAIQLPVPLPIDPNPDRFLLLALVAAAIVSILADSRSAPSRPAWSISVALLAFAAVALASLALNAQTLASLGDLGQGVKQFALLASFGGLFLFVATVIRPSELRNFGVLIVVLAAVTAIGTIYEYRSGVNVFYDLADQLLGGFASVKAPPASTLDSRAEVFGPTEHGLAIATILTLALPFAVLGVVSTRTRMRKVLYGLAVALIFAGAVCTQRKTSIIAPAIVVLVLVVYWPREMLRLAPLGVALLVLVHLIAPGAITGVTSQIFGGDLFGSDSSVARTSDYEAVSPDIATHPVLGRGYGSMDPTRSANYRILDNQYLGWVLQTGFLGLAVFLALLATAMALAHRVIRHGRSADERRTGLAALAGFAAFAVANAVFDLSSFFQVPYMFCVIAGLCSVAAHGLPAASFTFARREAPAG